MTIATGADLQTAAHDLIAWARKEGRVAELLTALGTARPQHPLVQACQAWLSAVGAADPAPTPEAAAFEAAYRRAVVRELDQLELFGVDLPPESSPQRLSIAYITLAVAALGPSPDADPHAAPDRPDPDRAEPDGAWQAVPALLATAPRLLIFGLAGSGKSTLLQWLAVQAAQQTFAGPLAAWNNLVPFFVRLRAFADQPLPTPETFPAHLAPEIAAIMPPQWVHTQLGAGRALVLVDGVDELPPARRPEVRQWLTRLVDSFPTAHVIVSSRPSAIQEGWLAADAFADVELQPMTLTDIDHFIDHWHAAVAAERGSA